MNSPELHMEFACLLKHESEFFEANDRTARTFESLQLSRWLSFTIMLTLSHRGQTGDTWIVPLTSSLLCLRTGLKRDKERAELRSNREEVSGFMKCNEGHHNMADHSSRSHHTGFQ